MLVVCGEALMDVYTAAATSTGLSLDARVGGSPFNVAVGLARLQQPVSFLGAISRRPLGSRLVQALWDEGVHTGTVLRTDAATTLALVELDEQGGASYAFYGDSGADRQLTPEAIDLVPADASLIHVGSYSAVVEPIASTLRMLVAQRRQTDRTVISFDLNVRLNVEPRIKVWQDQFEWMLPRTHILKSSDEDLMLLFPGRSLDSMASEWVAHHVPLAVVTCGARGAMAWCKQGRVEVPSVPVAVEDTVGAGDTFQAAMLAWLSENSLLSDQALRMITLAQLTRCLQFAAQAAAITCTRRGADLPRRSELGDVQ